MPLDHSPISRRTVAKGAAWSVPAVAVAASAPALAASPSNCEPGYDTITKTFEYKDILQNTVIVEVTAENVPTTAPAGATLMPISVTSTVTIPKASADLLTGLLLGGAALVGGTSDSTSSLSGALTRETTTALTIAATAPNAAGDLVLPASGEGSPMTVPSDATPGTVTITMGEPSSDLVGYEEDGTTETGTTTTLSKVDGNNYVLGTFEVCA